jgi:nucleotide-binding universal stress UspA family protein
MIANADGLRQMNLVLGLDGSSHSIVARDLVAGQRWPAETIVHLVGAYEVPIDWSGGYGNSMDWVGDAEDAIRDELTERLGSLSEPLAAAGLVTRVVAARGRPADVLLDAANTVDADLVVVGSRGLGSLRAMVLGSVAAEVAASAKCSVLVARASTMSRLLVATDGSGAMAHLVGHLGRWGFAAGLPADALAVAVPDSPAYELMVSLYTLGDDRLERQQETLARKAETDAERMAAELGRIGIQAEAITRSGDPAAVIVAEAERRGADLVVVGSRGLTGIDRLLLGSVARNVLSHAHCSVLVVRKES